MKKLIPILLCLVLAVTCAAVLPGQVRADDPAADLLTVDMPRYTVFRPGTDKPFTPTVTAGDKTLTDTVDYEYTFQDHTKAGQAKMILKGKGEYQGFEKSYSFQILRQDIAQTQITVEDTAFLGLPLPAEVTVKDQSVTLVEDQDYILICESNINPGTATVRVVGIGNYYGSVEKTFKIGLEDTELVLNGNYLGQVGGNLSEDVFLAEGYMTPGKLTCWANTTDRHAVDYELYRLEGENVVKITSLTKDLGNARDNAFTYDFSKVYDESETTEFYMLAYAWVTENGRCYGGAVMLYISPKVPDSKELGLAAREGTDSFRLTYLDMRSDGHAGVPQWSSSDTQVASVDKGVVTWKKPGTVTVTATWNGLSATTQLKAEVLDIADAVLLLSEDGAPVVLYENMALTVETDYTATATVSGGITQVTVTGTGLFAGQLVRHFDAHGNPLGDSHSFDSPCDDTCADCDFTRQAGHTHNSQWQRDEVGHWYSCSVCGEKLQYAAHTPSEDDADVCAVCGTQVIPGDFTGDGEVNNEDVAQLLWHTLFPERFPLNSNGDFTGDGEVNNEDVAQLLWHTLFPERFPLTPAANKEKEV